MSLLEQALSVTTYREPTIVSENHDASSINWVAGLTDPGEMLGCGKYQQLRRLAGEEDAPYQERLEALIAKLPAKVRAQLNEALGRAGYRRAMIDFSNGKAAVMVAGDAAWHGLGVQVSEAVTSAQAIRLASLNWTVGKRQMGYAHGNGQIDADGCFAMVRDDTGAFLGSVGPKYQPIQNHECFDFLDTVLNEFGARYETAGSLYGGKKIFMSVKLAGHTVNIGGKDVVDAYAVFVNSHDGTGAAKCFPTTHRVVCANTLRLAAKERGEGVNIAHTGNVQRKINAARTALGLTAEKIQEFGEHAQVMAQTDLEPIPYFDGVLDQICEISGSQAMMGADMLLDYSIKMTEIDRDAERARLDREIRNRKRLFDEVMERYESETNGVNGMRGTAWSAFNAVTESADHGRLGGRSVGDEKESRRFESVLNGQADEVKQIAYEQVLQVLGV